MKRSNDDEIVSNYDLYMRVKVDLFEPGFSSTEATSTYCINYWLKKTKYYDIMKKIMMSR